MAALIDRNSLSRIEFYRLDTFGTVHLANLEASVLFLNSLDRTLEEIRVRNPERIMERILRLEGGRIEAINQGIALISQNYEGISLEDIFQ